MEVHKLHKENNDIYFKAGTGVNKMYYSVMNITEQIAKNWPFSEQLSFKSIKEMSSYTKNIDPIL